MSEGIHVAWDSVLWGHDSARKWKVNMIVTCIFRHGGQVRYPGQEGL